MDEKSYQELLEELRQLRDENHSLKLLCDQKEGEEENLRQRLNTLDWMFKPKSMGASDYVQDYGSLVDLNDGGLIKRCVQPQQLQDIVSEYLDLLETSAVIFEKNGDYAMAILPSGWCQMMDSASRMLCDTDDNREALDSGKWLCRDSCWKDAASRAIDEGKPVEAECNGGLNIYAAPVWANQQVIGAISFGFGSPPKREAALKELAAKYKLTVSQLRKQAEQYTDRPSFVIEYAKYRIKKSARQLGFLVERKLEEDRIEELKEWHRTTISSIGDGVIITDTSGKVTNMNPAAQTYCGYSLKAATGKPFAEIFKIVNAKTRKPVTNPVKKVLESEKIVGLANHTVLISRNGKEYQIADTAAPIKDRYDQITGVVVVFSDVTQQYKAEQLLEKTKERYRIISETTSDFSFSCIKTDDEYQIDWIAGAVEKITGFTDDDIKAKKCWRFMVYPHDDPIFVRNVLELNPGDESQCELRVLDAAGEIRWLSVQTICLEGEGKEKRIIYGGCEDISERKTAEERLRESLRRLESFLQISQSMTSTLDQDKVMQKIVDDATRVMNLDSGAIYIRTNEKAIKLTATTPALPADFPESYRLSAIQDHPHIEKVFKTGEYVIMPDSATASLSPAEREIAEIRNLRSNLFLPIKLREEVIGVLILSSVNETYDFSDQEGSLLQGFADQAAQIISNIQNYTRLKRNEIRLQSQIRIMQYQTDSLQDFLDYALDEAIKLTESKIGYIYYYNEQTKEFTLNSWSKGVMQECSITDYQRVYKLENTGLWGEVVRQRKEIIINDFAAKNPLKKGHPKGHAPLKKFLSIPVSSDNQIVAVVGVANKETDYTNDDVLHLKLLMDGLWKEVERKKTLMALEESRKRFETLYHDSPVSILIHHKDTGEIMDANKTAYTAYGHESLEAFKNSDFCLDTPPYSQKDALEKIQVAIHEGTQVFEWKNQKVTGEIFWELVTLRPIVIDGVERILSTAIDITDQKQKEMEMEVLYEIANATFVSENVQSLLASIKELLHKLISTRNFYVAFYDREKNLFTIPYGEDEKDQIESWSAEKSVTGLVVKKKKALLLKKTQILQMISQGKVEQMGSMCEVWLGVPLFSGQKVIGVLTIQDYHNPEAYDQGGIEILEFVSSQVSMAVQRKQFIDDLVQAKEKAEESDRLKTAFLANMSHEIRTPMNGIMGFAELLKEPQLTTEMQQEYISVIEKSGERMLNLIDDIVDISRIEAGAMDIYPAKININEGLKYLYHFFKPQIEAKGMQLLLSETLPKENAWIVTDRKKLVSVLSNLIKNALKYSERGIIEFGCIKKGKSLQFFVKDMGIGIPKERQHAVFDRFVQADIEDSDARQGAGLGLAISKAYVEMMGGKIWVKSREGIGSSFYFTVPYKTAHEQTTNGAGKDTQIANEKQEPHLKVLIVEDDNTSASLMKKYLEPVGKEILHVDSGSKAVSLVQGHPDIDLVLMDIRMPGMDGKEATRQIRQFNKEVVIIAQTAKALTGDREALLQDGCTDYIAKPVGRNHLLKLIKKYCKE